MLRKTHKTKTQLTVNKLIGFLISDREGIRTPNPQSRNLIFYPVELRSRFFFILPKKGFTEEFLRN